MKQACVGLAMIMALGAPAFAQEAMKLPPDWRNAHAAGEAAVARHDLNAAETDFLEALAIAQHNADIQDNGDARALLAKSQNDLGVVFQAEGKRDQAETAYKASIALYQSLSSPSHPYMRMVLINLANLYQAEGRYDEMDALLSQNLPTRHEPLDDHAVATVAKPVYELANRLMRERRYDEATALYQKLLSWMPTDDHKNDLTGWRPDIEQRLSDLGHPVVSGVVPEEIEPRTQKEQVPASTQTISKDDPLFAPFLSHLNEKIHANWAPPDFYKEVPVTVLITLDRQGDLIDCRLKETSGFAPADEAALKAVADTGQFPPLPAQYASSYVVVAFSFNE